MLNLPADYRDNSASQKGVDLDAYRSKPNTQRALIIDDDPDTVDLIKIIFRNAGMDVIGAFSGLEAVQKCADVRPNIILLDLMMPGMDGWETYDKLRGMTDAPVIVVSADTKKENVVRGLNLGFDDYVTKPFYPAELVARVNTAIRRGKNLAPDTVKQFSEIHLSIDFDSHEVRLRGKPVHLSPREFAVLQILAKKAPRMVRYEELAVDVWGTDSIKIRNRIKYLVYLLRQKIEIDPNNPELIQNREGLGYQLKSGELDFTH
jgi:two-component system KDP operon response regulator KdpE